MNNRKSVLSVAIIAIVVAIIVYFWQKSSYNSLLKDIVGDYVDSTKIDDPSNWTKKVILYNPATYADSTIIPNSADESTIAKKKINLTNEPSNTRPTRYIYEYNQVIDLTDLSKYKSMGLDVHAKTSTEAFSNAFISLMIVDDLTINDPDNIIEFKNKWYDYQIVDSLSLCNTIKCKRDFDTTKVKRKNSGVMTIGAIHDMAVFYGHKVRLQLVLESEGKDKTKSTFDINNIKLHYFKKTKTELAKTIKKIINHLLYDENVLRANVLREVVDQGQTGPRVPPR
jgi:hypothetical protein